MGLVNEHFTNDLLDLVEDGLPPAERARLEAHLARCPACSQAAVEFHQLFDAMQTLPRGLASLTGAPGRGWPDVWAGVRRLPARRLTPQLSLGLSVVAALFVFITSFPAAAPVVAAATAGIAQAPWPAYDTPYVHTQAGPTDANPGPAVISASATGNAAEAGPIPIPTPIPGRPD
jgi:anti-sigma factor RsiW